MHTLVLTATVFAEIIFSVSETPDGLETGVKLFGTVVRAVPDPISLNAESASHNPPPSHNYVVLAIVGPGKKATHQAAHYSGDEEYASDIFAVLGCAMPGLEWLGELHVHPRGMTWLSAGDYRTVKEILTGSDDTVHPEEFIAGVMQRRNGTVDIYPQHFTRECLEGKAMEVQVIDSDTPLIHQARLEGIEKGNKKNDRPDLCTQPQGGGVPQQETSHHHWLRQWWERLGAYGRKIWHRQAHAR